MAHMNAKLTPLKIVLCLAPLMVKIWPFDKMISQGDTVYMIKKSTTTQGQW